MWKKKHDSRAWLFGIPGCGKSTLASGIIDNILQESQGDPDKALGYFYFNFNDIEFQRPQAMIKSLIKQLSHRCLKISPNLEIHYKACANGKRPPSPAMLLDILHILVLDHVDTYIVIDALDECGDREELLDSLTTIAQWELPNLHLILTSRPERDIERTLMTIVDSQYAIRLQNKEVDSDIRALVRHRLAQSKWKRDDNICQEIETELMQKAHGMYVMCMMVCEAVLLTSQVSLGHMPNGRIIQVSEQASASKVVENLATHT